jgi:hypothetical protein
MLWRPGISSKPRINLATKVGVIFALHVEERAAGRLLELESLMK